MGGTGQAGAATGGTSRRAVLGRLAVGGAVAWTVPIVTSTPAAAQATPQPPVDTLYGINWHSDSGLYVVDRATGAWTLVGSTGISSGAGLAWDSAAGQMWACTQSGLSCTLDHTTGAVVDTTSVGLACGGMTYDSTDDVLLGCAWDSHGTYTVDRATGAWTLLGPTGVDDSNQERGMAYDPDTETIFGCDSQGSTYIVNGTTGAWTFLGSTGPPGTESGLAFDTATGTLYGCDFADRLYTVDTATGTWSLVGQSPPVPFFTLGLTYVP